MTIKPSSSSHGMMKSKARLGVRTSRTLPTIPPTKVIAESVATERPPTGSSSSRYSAALATAPGSKATLEVALATFAGRPSAISAGRVAKVPPPASAFITPPTHPAPAAKAIAAKSGCSARAALAFGRGLQLAARSVDVTAPRSPYGRGNAGFKDDVAERADSLVIRAFVGRSRPRVERDEVHL